MVSQGHHPQIAATIRLVKYSNLLRIMGIWDLTKKHGDLMVI